MVAAHVPVLLVDVLEVLRPGSGGRLFDGTLGLGGHSSGWLAATAAAGTTGMVVGVDRDPQALHTAEARLEAAFPGCSNVYRGSYEEATAAVRAAGIRDVDAALMDLGASSLQLDDRERGFSFRASGPLDMLMDPASSPTAAEFVNGSSEADLEDVISRYGEDPHARRIARAIVVERRRAPFTDTLRLAECVARASGGRRGRRHPATRTFQALRIAVNDELGRLERGLPEVARCVRGGGRMAVVTFHRLEDAIVKRFFRDSERAGWCRRLPDRTPASDEVRRNPRSRSARLRTIETLPALDGSQRELETRVASPVARGGTA